MIASGGAGGAARRRRAERRAGGAARVDPAREPGAARDPARRAPRARRSRFAMQPELRAAIVQDAETNRVLMLAWMDDEALRLTRETGEAHFFSRSRSSSGARARRPGTRSPSRSCATTATATRSSCASARPGRPATRARVSCFAPWLWRRVAERARDAARGLLRRRARGRGPGGCCAEGRRGGRRGRARRSGGERRAARLRARGPLVPHATCCSRRAGSTLRRSRTSSSGGRAGERRPIVYARLAVTYGAGWPADRSCALDRRRSCRLHRTCAFASGSSSASRS